MTTLEETINYFKEQGSVTTNGDIVASLSYIQKYKNKSEEQIIFESYTKSKSSGPDQNENERPSFSNSLDSQTNSFQASILNSPSQGTQKAEGTKVLSNFGARFQRQKEKKQEQVPPSSLLEPQRNIEANYNEIDTPQLNLSETMEIQQKDLQRKGQLYQKTSEYMPRYDEGDYRDERVEEQHTNLYKQNKTESSSIAESLQNRFQAFKSKNTPLLDRSTKENERDAELERKIQIEKEEKQREQDLQRKKEEEEKEREKIKQQKEEWRKDMERKKEEELAKLRKEKEDEEERKKFLENEEQKKKKEQEEKRLKEEELERQRLMRETRESSKQFLSQNKEPNDPMISVRGKDLMMISEQMSSAARRNGSDASTSGARSIPDRLKRIEELLTHILEKQNYIEERLERLEEQQHKTLSIQDEQSVVLEDLKRNLIG